MSSVIGASEAETEMAASQKVVRVIPAEGPETNEAMRRGRLDEQQRLVEEAACRRLDQSFEVLEMVQRI